MYPAGRAPAPAGGVDVSFEICQACSTQVRRHPGISRSAVPGSRLSFSRIVLKCRPLEPTDERCQPAVGCATDSRRHPRRKILHLNVTQHPTAGWLSRQITEAFPWDTAPRYLLRDRDASYGSDFRCRVEAMGITEVVTAPRSPWQNPYVERVIGSIRRECLDHIVVI